jgi:hypothetical protein
MHSDCYTVFVKVPSHCSHVQLWLEILQQPPIWTILQFDFLGLFPIYICSIQIKLLIETKPIVCLPSEILHYKVSREKLEPEPEVRGSNPGSGSRFSLEIL